ncbi:trigger factor [Sphingomonas guangdongensis]|uniref:Trigger factor n=1 Tax=Sphingomonas guangdongensis TaxID=1141890 RepID=A0A285R3J5_9SPHN|nr:trigger factor [Sphingomonas guangdongensis]SOB86932.1 trigger factor [Sphingomonas guangdongensis]
MQTVETLNEGLKRAYTLTITARDIDSKVDAEVKRVAPQVRMPGFRPGKVPANLVRKMHGEALAQDALNSAIQQGVQDLLQQKALRPAMQPSVRLNDQFAPGQDAEITVELEVLPDVPAPSIDGLKLERLTVAADESAVDDRIAELAKGNKSFDDASEGHAAQTGDLVVMDFVGKTADGVAFEGGTGTDMSVEIGSGRLIPGFEDQIIGVIKGEERQISVTFPEDYGAKNLAGQPATFDLTIKDVRVAGETRIDDEMAKQLGLESLEQLRGLIKGQAEQELNGLTRTHMKRKLLDQLAAGHDFPVPPSMVEAEFQQIWAQLTHETEHEADPAAAMAELESEKDDYRKIAERRVRLGLLLSEIGQANGIEVSQQEMNMLVQQAAQQYAPDQRQRFVEYLQQEPMAAAQLRAPLYEDKVVDFLFERAEISERAVTREELEAAIESDDGFTTGTHTHDHDKPAKRKSAKAKNEAGASDEAAATPPKKPAAKKAKAAEVTDADIEPAAADAEPVAAEPVKKAATRKAPAKKDAAPVAEGEAAADAPAKPKRAPTKKKAEA